MTGRVRIGLSGWNYAPWRRKFYPADLPHRRELAFAASRFSSIEVNSTFYGLRRPEDFTRWRDQTPDDFVFALKGSRYITHMLKLTDPTTPVANFLAQGLLKLGPKLGPILWQFPERLAFDAARFESFMQLLPRDTDELRRLAKRHDARLKGRSALHIEAHLPIRHAMEIRHESFRSPAFIRMLRRHGMALVCADAVEWPLLMDLTTDFVYCRLHGSRELYVSGYDPSDLARWATRVKAWVGGTDPRGAPRIMQASKPRKNGRDVYLYFDNDAKVRAPADAAALRARIPAQMQSGAAMPANMDGL